MWDLLDGTEVKDVKKFTRSKYEVIIDATGVERALLGPIKGGILRIAYQELIKTDKFSSDTMHFIDKPNAIEGYFWIFPAGKYFHFGYVFTGRKKPKIEGKRICKCSKKVRLLPPSKCKPFFKENIVGVGSAIGAINPLTAEGIVPSLQSALLLHENFHDWQAYERARMLYILWYRMGYTEEELQNTTKLSLNDIRRWREAYKNMNEQFLPNYSHHT